MRLFWGACCIFITIQVVRCQVQTLGDKTSDFIKRKFSNYDKSVRPNFGDKPVQVTVSGYVLDLHDINESNQEFTVTLYLRHEWKDPRLEFTESEAGADKLVLNKEYAEKIWMVDTFIVNERESKVHDLLTANEFTRISTDGTVLISTRFSIKASCKMELGWFPFDRHTCALVMESYGHGAADFIYGWKADESGDTKKAVGVSQETSSIQFAVAGVNTKMEMVPFRNKSFSKLAVEFFLIRASTRYVHEVYLPAILLTCMSFITLFHGTGTSKTRLHLSIFIEGIIIILMALTAKTMPPVSYQTALDFYLVVCLLIVTCVVIVNVAICLMLSSTTDSNGVVRLRSCNEESTNAEEDGKEVLFDTGARLSNRTSRMFTLLIKLRLGIPLVFVVFNLLYWMIVLIGSSFFPEDFLILENWNI